MPDNPLDALLSRLVEVDGTDLFLTVGAPASATVQKRMTPLMERPLTPQDLERVIEPILAVQERAERFESHPDLDLSYALAGKGRFRLSIFRQRGSLALVARRVKLTIPSFESLGLPPVLGKVALERKGLILVTGATGSGKSSTLAAMIDHRNRSADGHILTIEDPIEFVHDHKKCIVTQREVGVDTASFESAMKSALRQAPDVLLIGEVRDRETAGAALELAETGHLVLATLHSSSAAQTLERLTNLFPPDARPSMQLLLSLNLSAIVSQRLVPSAAARGRIAVIELLLPTPRVRDLVRDGAIDTIKEAMREGIADGMQTFDEALYQLVRAGRLTLPEALPFSESPADLRLRFRLEAQQGERPETIRFA